MTRRCLRRARRPLPRRRSGRSRAHMVSRRGAYAAVNRHDLPAWTADAVNIDHRSTTAVAPGELSAYLHATWGQTPDFKVDIVAVHRLSSFGALVTHVATGSTEQGFEGEWREITLSMIEGDRISAASFSTRPTSMQHSPDSTNWPARQHDWRTRRAEWRRAARRTSLQGTGTRWQQRWPTTS